MMTSWTRGGDSGILSLLRVSLRARRLGRSGGEVGVKMGAESMEEVGEEFAVVADSGVQISGLGIEEAMAVVVEVAFGRTIEYKKCLCVFSQHGVDTFSPILVGGLELHAEIGV